ncbi:MAG: hypothetical protein LBI18_01325 [Planctomycetaceae bacterium]|nr:hypothetical protein [Planctomycetaceae bacterium]
MFILLTLPIVLCTGLSLASEAEALNLLKAIENERMKYNCFHISYTEQRIDDGGITIKQEVDFDHGKIRKFHLKTEHFPGWAEVLNGDEFYRYTFDEHEDVMLAASNSEEAKYTGIYDPRILGLTDFPILPNTVKSCLLYGRLSGFTVEDTVLDGRKIKRVSINDNDEKKHWDIYITEPEFNLIKKVYSSSTINITITNKYDNPKLGPFPSEIKILRTDEGNTVFNRVINITDFEEKKTFAPDTFSYKAMNLPINTAVIDYRIHQRLGYWDGEKLVEKPVSIRHRSCMK